MIMVLALGAAQVTAQPNAPSAAATIKVRVPAVAAVTFDGYATQSRGPVRTFSTPALAPGKTFTYEIAAVWNENGKPRRAARQVTVRGGETKVVDFTAGDFLDDERDSGFLVTRSYLVPRRFVDPVERNCQVREPRLCAQ